MRVNRDQAGFTLIELLVVVAIIGILATAVALSVFRQKIVVENTRVEADFRTLDDAIAMFRNDMSRYPASLDELCQEPADATQWMGPYIRHGEMPRDPWDRPYVYEYPAQGPAGYDLVCYGADGVTGGTESNIDHRFSQMLDHQR